jgi:hypothetical protein
MAIVYDPNKDPKTQSGAAPGAGAGANAGPGPIQAGGGQAQQKVGAPPKATSSGRFSNINKYIQANTGVDYAGRLGGEIGKQQEDLRAGVEAGRQQMQSQVNPEMQRLQQAGQTIQQATQDPTQFAANQQNVEAFNRLRQGQFLNQAQVQNEAQLANQMQDLQRRAQMAGTETGRFQLLRESFGGTAPRYTTGQQRLDQLLLQGQRGQLGQLQQTAQQQAQAGEQAVAGLKTEAQQATEQLQQLGKTAQQQAQEAITGKISSEQEALQQRAAQEQTAREQKFSALQEGLKKGEITEEQAKELGLDASGDISLYGLDPSQMLNQAALGKVGVGNVATAEDQARMEALAKLSGQQELGMFAKPQGQLAGVGSTFAKDIFQQQQAGRKAEYEQRAQEAFQNLARESNDPAILAKMEEARKAGTLGSTYQDIVGKTRQVADIQQQAEDKFRQGDIRGARQLLQQATDIYRPTVSGRDVGGDITNWIAGSEGWDASTNPLAMSQAQMAANQLAGVRQQFQKFAGVGEQGTQALTPYQNMLRIIRNQQQAGGAA